MKKSGILIGDNFKLLDGKVVPDLKRSLASLPVNKRIAAAKGKKNGVKVVKPSKI